MLDFDDLDGRITDEDLKILHGIRLFDV